MKNQTAKYQAQLFLYDLSNSAKEHWFKSDEGWDASLGTDEDKWPLKKNMTRQFRPNSRLRY